MSRTFGVPHSTLCLGFADPISESLHNYEVSRLLLGTFGVRKLALMADVGALFSTRTMTSKYFYVALNFGCFFDICNDEDAR